MNKHLLRLIPTLILACAALPARAAMLGMGAAASRSAVRAQMPVLLNQFFAQPNPSTRAQLLTGLSLSGNDRFINEAVRLSVAQNLAEIDVSAQRIANAPGAADPENEHAQARVQGITDYRAFVLETLQLPHVAQHLTKAQRADIAVRAADAGVVLTAQKADALILKAQEEIEKLIAGQRQAEEGFATSAQGETPAAPKLGRSVPQDPGAMARAAIPSPASLSAKAGEGKTLWRDVALHGVTGLLLAAMAAFVHGPAMLILGAGAAGYGAFALLSLIPATSAFSRKASAWVGFGVSTLIAAQILGPLSAKAVGAAGLALWSGLAASDGRKRMSLIFAAAAFGGGYAAIHALFPALSIANALVVAAASTGLLHQLGALRGRPRLAAGLAAGLLAVLALGALALGGGTLAYLLWLNPAGLTVSYLAGGASVIWGVFTAATLVSRGVVPLAARAAGRPLGEREI